MRIQKFNPNGFSSNEFVLESAAITSRKQEQGQADPDMRPKVTPMHQGNEPVIQVHSTSVHVTSQPARYEIL